VQYEVVWEQWAVTISEVFKCILSIYLRKLKERG